MMNPNFGMDMNNFMNNYMNMMNGNNGMINFQNKMIICIIFSNKTDLKPVLTDPQEKIKDLIQKYRNKTGAGDYYIYI